MTGASAGASVRALTRVMPAGLQEGVIRWAQAVRERGYIILWSAVPSIILLVLYLTKPQWADEGLVGNLLAEAIGLFIALLLVQSLLDAQERKRTLSARFGAYLEAARVWGSIRQRWISILMATVTEIPEPEDDIFAEKYLSEVQSHFDEQSTSEFGTSTTTWVIRNHEWRKSVARQLNKTFERYPGNIAPELHAILLRIEATATFTALDWVIPFHVTSGQVGLFRELHSVLIRLAPEFQALPGFFEPASTTFADAIGQFQSVPGGLGKARLLR